MGNPFYERGMIKEKEDFFGRKTELKQTFNWLRVMQSVSVVGGPKIGKSSFLYRLARLAPDKLGAGYTCHYLDLQGVTSDREFYGRAVAALGGGGDSHRDLQRAIEGKKAVLCLDEFENAADSASFDADFFNVMRSLAQTGNLALVVATQTPLPELSHKSTVRTSPFYNIFVPLPLDSLTEAEARQMLAVLSARGGRPFGDDEMAWAIKAAGTHPWRLQVLAYHLFEAGEQGEPDKARVKRLYREEVRLAGRSLDGQATPDRRQRFKPLLVILTALTIFSAFFFAAVSNVYGIYLALALAGVTLGLTVYTYWWPGSRRSQ